MANLDVISTEKMQSQDKLTQWQRSAWMETGHSRSRLIQATSFDGVLQYGQLDAIKLYKLSVSPHRIMSSSEGVHPNTRGMVKAILQVKGTTHYQQFGREVLLEPGTWMLRDMDVPYSIDIREDCELIALIIPQVAVSSSFSIANQDAKFAP